MPKNIEPYMMEVVKATLYRTFCWSSPSMIQKVEYDRFIVRELCIKKVEARWNIMLLVRGFYDTTCFC